MIKKMTVMVIKMKIMLMIEMVMIELMMMKTDDGVKREMIKMVKVIQ